MRRFLIAGCQRSGTTMMRLILESHEDIQCVDEQFSYEVLAGRLAAPETSAAFLGFKIPVWTEQLLRPRLYWNEYAYLHGSEPVPSFYDHEPIIFMIRSPFDTISSMLRLKIASDSWLRRVGAPVVRSMAESGRLAAEYRADLDFAESCEDPEVAFGALYWKIKSSAALSYLDAGLPVHLVIYERFVATPQAFLPDILGHIGARWDESVLRHHERPHDEIIEGKAIGDTDPARSIDTRSIGQAGVHLSALQVQLIEHIVCDLEKTLHSRSPQETRQ